jgi:serine/threonine protein kinase
LPARYGQFCSSPKNELILHISYPAEWAMMHVKYLMFQLMSGLAYIHARSIVHRDIKVPSWSCILFLLMAFCLQPSNLLANEACELKICDFGLSRSIITEAQAAKLESSERPSMVALHRQLTGHVVTRWYRAPELIVKQEEYNFGVDNWSAGCIFAELIQSLTPGTKVRPLFPGDSSNLACPEESPEGEDGGEDGFALQGEAGGLENDAQLHKILDTMGTPSAAELEVYGESRMKTVLQRCTAFPGKDLKRLLPALDDDEFAMLLLKSMVHLDSSQRISSADVLTHDFFADMPADWKTVHGQKLDGPFNEDPIALDFEYSDTQMSTSDLRQRINEEVAVYTARESQRIRTGGDTNPKQAPLFKERQSELTCKDYRRYFKQQIQAVNNNAENNAEHDQENAYTCKCYVCECKRLRNLKAIKEVFEMVYAALQRAEKEQNREQVEKETVTLRNLLVPNDPSQWAPDQLGKNLLYDQARISKDLAEKDAANGSTQAGKDAAKEALALYELIEEWRTIGYRNIAYWQPIVQSILSDEPFNPSKNAPQAVRLSPSSKQPCYQSSLCEACACKRTPQAGVRPGLAGAPMRTILERQQSIHDLAKVYIVCRDTSSAGTLARLVLEKKLRITGRYDSNGDADQTAITVVMTRNVDGDYSSELEDIDKARLFLIDTSGTLDLTAFNSAAPHVPCTHWNASKDGTEVPPGLLGALFAFATESCLRSSSQRQNAKTVTFGVVQQEREQKLAEGWKLCGAGASEVETLFSYLSSDRAKLLRDELKGHQVVLQAVGSDAKKATASTVEALKTIEGMLRETCLANGLADGEGGVVVQKVKKGISRPMKLHGMGAYLIECEAMKAHLPKPLLTRLHAAKTARNQFAHGSGLLCEASKGLDLCLLGFELLEAVSPATGGSGLELVEAASVKAANRATAAEDGALRRTQKAMISWRMAESKAEVKVLQAALEGLGVEVIVISELAGADLLKAVSAGMDVADIFIIMGTETYGKETSGSIDTYKEMQQIVSSNKPYFLINMNPETSLMRFQESSTNLLFPLANMSWERWEVGAPMPLNLPQKVANKVLQAVNMVPTNGPVSAVSGNVLTAHASQPALSTAAPSAPSSNTTTPPAPGVSPGSAKPTALQRLAAIEMNGIGSVQEGALIQRIRDAEIQVLGEAGTGTPATRLTKLEEGLGI